MTKKVLLDAQVAIDGDDLTDYCYKVEISDEFDAKKTTTYGSGGAEENLGGIEKYEVTFGFKNSYTVGELDDIMWAKRRQVVPWTARADEDPVSTSNPQYGGDVLITKWVPISGTVGDVAEVDVSYPGSGPLERATST